MLIDNRIIIQCIQKLVSVSDLKQSCIELVHANQKDYDSLLDGTNRESEAYIRSRIADRNQAAIHKIDQVGELNTQIEPLINEILRTLEPNLN